MGKIKKKYESGAATAFIARNQAIKKLQLTIADFRRLCILKGVYPVEPKNKKKVNKGSTANRTFYYAKDISFLANEPIVNKFRDFKVYVKRLKRAKGRRDIKAIGRIRANKPSYNVDHIVKERYPTYIDAIRDLDDCLSLIFLFAILPKSKRVFVERVHLCKRLSLEFMHYVIASKALRKCFISIKGYYFQAEIKGQKVTWVMPHKLAYQTPDDVDFRIMSTFVEFYSILLGFINFKSYQELGLIYPPKLSINQNSGRLFENRLNAIDLNDEYLASLNCDFLKIDETDDLLKNEFLLADEESSEQLENARLQEENLNKLKNLFKGLKFFLNREVPREQFVLAIKSFSGVVSWDDSTGLGATYQEDDQSITHQIIDRPLAGKTYLNRVYVQPQWVFDCINENMLLPIDDYLPGSILPPHLSPFAETTCDTYVPPEKQRLIKMKLGFTEIDEKNEQTEVKPKEIIIKRDNHNDKETTKFKNALRKNNQNNSKTSSSQDLNDDKKDNEDVDTENEEDINDMKVDLDSPDEEYGEEDSENELLTKEKQEVEKKNDKSLLAVVRSIPKNESTNMLIKKQVDEEKKLSELMIPKKNKRLYNKIMYSKKKEKHEIEKLRQKRERYEELVKKIK